MKIFLIILILSSILFTQPELGVKPKKIILHEDTGGRTDGSAWDSSTINGKVYAMFYVDPDEKDLNLAMEEALEAENFSKEKFSSIAVINMKATWLPKWLISSMLKRKQEKYPDTIYVKDRAKVLVNKWKFKDDSYVVAIFDREGKMIFYKGGTLSAEEIKKMIKVIKDHL